MDIKPWSSETDIDAMEKAVRTIEADGLLWGQCKSIEKRIVYFDCYLFLFIAKQVPVAFGLHKLEIACVIEDDKVRPKKKIFLLIIVYSYTYYRLELIFSKKRFVNLMNTFNQLTLLPSINFKQMTFFFYST